MHEKMDTISSRGRMPVAVIIIPTYNEAGSIATLLDYFSDRVVPQVTGWAIKILVVDGNSPDGTAQIAQKKALQLPFVHVLAETKRGGIGAAYRTGFDYAIRILHADAVFEFDADFQHPPELVPIMLAKLDEGFDCVTGSRKIKGGGEVAGRSMVRSALTSWGGYSARVLLFWPLAAFYRVTDPTTGLRVTRVKGFLDESWQYGTGFGYKVSLLSALVKNDARYAEVPLLFQNRRTGVSKCDLYSAFDVLASCLRTRFHKN